MYLHLPSTLKMYNMTQNTRNAFFFINWQAMCFAAVGRLYKLCIQIWLKHKHYKFFLLYFYFSCLNKQFVMSAHIRHTIFIFFFWLPTLFAGLLWRGVAVFGALHQHCGGLCRGTGGVRGEGNFVSKIDQYSLNVSKFTHLMTSITNLDLWLLNLKAVCLNMFFVKSLLIIKSC